MQDQRVIVSPFQRRAGLVHLGLDFQQVCNARHAGPAKHIGAVHLDGARADTQQSRSDFVTGAAMQRPQNILFSWREVVQNLRSLFLIA